MTRASIGSGRLSPSLHDHAALWNTPLTGRETPPRVGSRRTSTFTHCTNRSSYRRLSKQEELCWAPARRRTACNITRTRRIGFRRSPTGRRECARRTRSSSPAERRTTWEFAASTAANTVRIPSKRPHRRHRSVPCS